MNRQASTTRRPVETRCPAFKPEGPADWSTVFIGEASVIRGASWQRLQQRRTAAAFLGRMHPPLTRQYVQANDLVKFERFNVVSSHLGYAASEFHLTDLLDQAIHTGSKPRLDLVQHAT